MFFRIDEYNERGLTKLGLLDTARQMSRFGIFGFWLIYVYAYYFILLLLAAAFVPDSIPIFPFGEITARWLAYGPLNISAQGGVDLGALLASRKHQLIAHAYFFHMAITAALYGCTAWYWQRIKQVVPARLIRAAKRLPKNYSASANFCCSGCCP